jgi:hypothetical protein
MKGEDGMNAMLESERKPEDDPALVTTLYDLIEAMQDEASPEADDVVITAVLELLRTGRVAFLRQLPDQQPFRPTLAGMSYS